MIELNLDAYERQPDLVNRVELLLFAIARHKLMVAMVRRDTPPFARSLVLPGCYLGAHESAWGTAVTLRRTIGVPAAKLEDFGNASESNRDPRGRCVSMLYLGAVSEAELWRVTDTVYDSHLVEVRRGADDEITLSANGEPVSAGFDHLQLIKRGVKHLRTMLDSSLIALASALVV